MSAPLCPRCGQTMVEEFGLLRCNREGHLGTYYERSASGRLRVAPSPLDETEEEARDEEERERMVDSVADRWTPAMSRPMIHGGKKR